MSGAVMYSWLVEYLSPPKLSNSKHRFLYRPNVIVLLPRRFEREGRANLVLPFFMKEWYDEVSS
jgi:hypothetical protein